MRAHKLAKAASSRAPVGGSPGQQGRISCSGLTEVAVTGVIGLLLSSFVWILWSVFRKELPGPLPLGLEGENWQSFTTGVAILISLGALGVFWRSLRNYNLLGPAHLQMDPFPAGVGGDVGGVIDLPTRLSERDRVKLHLQCLRRRRDNSRTDSRWLESVLWEAEGRPELFNRGGGSRLVMRFAPPPDSSPSQDGSTEQVVWRLHLEANLQGQALHRQFILPLDSTPRSSSPELQRSALTSSRPAESELPPGWVQEQWAPGRNIFYFPAFRHLKTKLSLAAFGLLFFGLTGAVMLWLNIIGHREAPPLFFSLIFLAFGSFMVLPVFWLPFSYRLTVSTSGLEWQRFWLGVQVGSWQLPRSQIHSLSHKSGSQIGSRQQGRQEVFYHLVAHSSDGRKLACSGGLPGPAAIELLEKKVKDSLGWQD